MFCALFQANPRQYPPPDCLYKHKADGATAGSPEYADAVSLDIVSLIVNYIVMKEYKTERANIAQIKESLSAYVTMAEQGKTVVVCRRNKPVAELVPVETALQPNRTRLGSARDSVVVTCDLTAPAMDEEEWGTLR